MQVMDGYTNYVSPTFDNDAVVITSDRDVEDNDGTSIFNTTSLKDALAKIVKYAQLMEEYEISNKNGD